MRVAMLAPIAWRVPPRHYGPWERVVSLLTEGLVAAGLEVTLFATLDSRTSARLDGVCPRPYEEDPEIDAKVWESLHVAHALERAGDFDLVHNHADFVPLCYAPLVRTPLLTTVHGFSSQRILPAYRSFGRRAAAGGFVSISDADRHPDLGYLATVHHGIDFGEFTFRPDAGDYLLFFGRIHPDKGAHEAIRLARRAGLPLRMAGIVQDRDYFERRVEPQLGGEVDYLGSVGPAERDALLGGARALLHPIAFDEPFGLSMIEAMACGTPVIAYARGSVPEVVDDGVTGFVVDGFEEAAAAIERIADLDRAAVRARARARFGTERMVADYRRVYARAVAA